MARRTPAAETPTSTRKLVLDTLHRQIPDRETADRVVALAESTFAAYREVQDAPPEATTDDLLASLRHGGEGLLSLGECLAEMPERIVGRMPPEMKDAMRHLATSLAHLGRSTESLCEGLGALAAWAEGGDRE